MDASAREAIFQGDFSGAIKLLTQLIENCNDDALRISHLYCNRAGCYERLELFKHVVKDCDEAIQYDANHLRAHIRKGYALKRLNKKKDWQRYVSVAKGKLELAGNVDLELLLQLREIVTQLFENLPGRAEPETSVRQDGLQTTNPKRAEDAPIVTPRTPTYSAPDAHDLDSVVSPSSAPAARSESVAAPSSKIDPTPKPTGAVRLIAIKALQDQIQAGILKMNGAHFAEALAMFDQVLASALPEGADGTSVALHAHMARGTARAMLRDLQAAEEDFSAAIRLQPDCGEAWKRRGQTRAALGSDTDAIRDLTQALEAGGGNCAELYNERGLVHHKLRDYRRGWADFEAVTRLNPTSVPGWKMLGLCYMCAGECPQALKAFKQCVTIDPQYKEAWNFIGQVHKELAQADSAMEHFSKALAIDPGYVSAHRFVGMLHHGLGKHRQAARHFSKALEHDPNLLEARFMRAVCLHALGHHKAAAADYTVVLASSNVGDDNLVLKHLSHYQREGAHFIRFHLDTPLVPAFLDDKLHPLFKEAWCKKLPPTVLQDCAHRPTLGADTGALWAHDTSQVGDAATACALTPPQGVPRCATMNDPKVVKLVAAAETVGRLLHYNCPGFLSNQRQQRMGGMAAIHLAQVIKQQIKKRQMMSPVLGWREVFDVAVRWRQVSEPNDPVCWVDKLTQREFEAGFGSHTPMLSGQTKVPRYYPNFSKAFALMKALALQRNHVFNAHNKKVTFEAGAQRAAIDMAADCAALYAAVDCGDFWLCTPCEQVSKKGVDMDGTRLTLQKLKTPDGYELSIRTPCTPPRWKDFDAELQRVWLSIVTLAAEDKDSLKLREKILTLAFYWYNFMPLARGTAATGYVAILGFFLAIGHPVTVPTPPGVQVDWEAILCKSPAEFITSVGSWLLPGSCDAERGYEDTSRSQMPDPAVLPSVGETFPTMRRIIEGLNNDGWQI